MGAWRRLESPKLRIPLELREVTSPETPVRIFEVQELRQGCVFKASLTPQAREEAAERGTSSGRLTDAVIEHAVALAVEEALLTPPEKELGETYEISVRAEELREAAAAAG